MGSSPTASAGVPTPPRSTDLIESTARLAGLPAHLRHARRPLIYAISTTRAEAPPPPLQMPAAYEHARESAVSASKLTSKKQPPTTTRGSSLRSAYTELASLLLQHVEQRDNDARAAAANGMPKRDSAAVDIHLGRVQVEHSVVDDGDDGECFVDLFPHTGNRAEESLGQRGHVARYGARS